MRLTHRLLEEARRNGAVVHTDTQVSDVARNGDGWHLTLTGKQRLRADALVNAAGRGASGIRDLARDLLAHVRDLLPHLTDTASLRHRVLPAGGHPCVGGLAGRPGYYEAVSHSGVILAPLIGRNEQRATSDGIA